VLPLDKRMQASWLLAQHIPQSVVHFAPTGPPCPILFALPTGTGVHVYVLDTGVRTTHQEFGLCTLGADGGCAAAHLATGEATRVGAGFNAVDGGGGLEDCHGHGTHVRAESERWLSHRL
jgi:subtilisin family serine protease